LAGEGSVGRRIVEKMRKRAIEYYYKKKEERQNNAE
jgi:hypothetical protein